jgi:hypothetical protein
MPITLNTQPVTASASLTTTDVTALLNAIVGQVSLPTNETATNIVALNVTINSDRTGVINIRFNK